MTNPFSEEWLEAQRARRASQRAVERVKAPGLDDGSTHVSPDRTAARGERPENPRTNSKEYREEALQKQVAEFLDRCLMPPWRWIHVPNQRGTRKAWENKLLKTMGVKAGAADVLLLGPSGFVWIELKSTTGALSEAQKDWRDWCRRIRAPWFLCRSLDDVLEALQIAGVRVSGRPS